MMQVRVICNSNEIVGIMGNFMLVSRFYLVLFGQQVQNLWDFTLESWCISLIFRGRKRRKT